MGSASGSRVRLRPFDGPFELFVQIEVAVESDITAHLVPCDQKQVPVGLGSQAAPQREFLFTVGVDRLNVESYRDIWSLLIR